MWRLIVNRLSSSADDKTVGILDIPLGTVSTGAFNLSFEKKPFIKTDISKLHISYSGSLEAQIAEELVTA